MRGGWGEEAMEDGVRVLVRAAGEEGPVGGEAGNWMGSQQCPEKTQEAAWSPRPGSRPQHRRCYSRTAARSRRGRS